MSDFFKALGNAVGSTVRQAEKTAKDIGEGVANAVTQADQAAAQGLNEFVEGMNKELNDVGEKAKTGDFLGAALEMFDVGSPGSVVSEGLAALGFGPKDTFGKELVSGLANYAAGNPFGALKDLGDAFGALSTGAAGATGMPPMPSQWMPSPTSVFHDIRDTANSAAALMASTPRGYSSINVNVNVNVNVNHHMMIRPGCTAIQWNNWIKLNPPIMQPPGRVLADVARGAIDRAVEDAGGRTGAPCRDRPMSERTIGDILNDPTLCFEDMVAMVMMKVCQDMQEQVREQIEKMEGMTGDKASGSAKGTEGTGKGTEGAGKGTEGAGKGTEGAGKGAEGGSGADKAAGGGMSLFERFIAPDPKDLPFLALDALIGGGLGLMIGRGLTESGSLSKELLGSLDPNMVGGIMDGLKGLAPVVAPLVSAACAAFPPIGTAIAPFVPFLLPVVMDLAGSALQGAVGEAQSSGGSDGSGAAGDKPNPGMSAPGEGSVGGTGGKEQTAGKKDQDSINLEMEKLKMIMQRMQEMQQAMSNVLNTMHQGAMNSIRNIK